MNKRAIFFLALVLIFLPILMAKLLNKQDARRLRKEQNKDAVMILKWCSKARQPESPYESGTGKGTSTVAKVRL
jgi:hypothetical protein